MTSTPARGLFSLVVCSGLLAVAGPAKATVSWTSTFEKGDLSEWMPGVNPTKGTRKNVEVLGEQVYTGKYACKITVHPDDLFGQYVQDRVDIQHQSKLTGEGMDTWISGHYMMPADAGMRNEFAFWESNSTSQNVMDFWVAPKGAAGGGTTINFGVGFLGATKLWTADFTIGKWHQVAMHVHWSTNAQLGSVDVWYDGQQVVTAHKAQTKADNNSLFYQNGLHRISPANFVDTIYFDDFIEADTLAEAQIAAPIQPGGDGGVATDGGPMDDAAADGNVTGSGGAGGSGAGGESGSGGSSVDGGAGGASGAATGSGGARVMGGASGGGGSGVSGGGVATSHGCLVSGRRPPTMSLLGLLGLGAVVLSSRRRRR